MYRPETWLSPSDIATIGLKNKACAGELLSCLQSRAYKECKTELNTKK